MKLHLFVGSVIADIVVSVHSAQQSHWKELSIALGSFYSYYFVCTLNKWHQNFITLISHFKLASISTKMVFPVLIFYIAYVLCTHTFYVSRHYFPICLTRCASIRRIRHALCPLHKVMNKSTENNHFLLRSFVFHFTLAQVIKYFTCVKWYFQRRFTLWRGHPNKAKYSSDFKPKNSKGTLRHCKL